MNLNLSASTQSLLYFLGMFFGTIILAAIVSRSFKRLRKKPIIQDHNPTNYLFLRHLSVGLIYTVGFGLALFQLPQFKTLAGSLLTGAGIIAVAMGFASQHALSNIVGGIFIVIFKPFKVNDRLTIGTRAGVVEDITLRHTVIRDFENRRIIIPNSVISNEVIVNADFTDGKICKWIELSISYESDIDLAKQIIAEEILAHPLIIDNRNPEQIEANAPIVPVRLTLLGDSGVNLRAWAWVKDNADAFALSCDVLESIKKRFDQSGIEIPYPHRTIVQKVAKHES
ncbi:MAG: mechanosensitive ion channel family protein [Saprospiraceae bacterium]